MFRKANIARYHKAMNGNKWSAGGNLLLSSKPIGAVKSLEPISSPGREALLIDWIVVVSGGQNFLISNLLLMINQST
jgi:hypothetical protein